VKEKPISISKKEQVPLYERIRQILESARTSMARTVNTTQVVANWLIGREIVPWITWRCSAASTMSIRP